MKGLIPTALTVLLLTTNTVALDNICYKINETGVQAGTYSDGACRFK